MKDQLDQLYAQEMSRSDFLRYVSIVLMGVLGITSIMRLVLHTDISRFSAVEHGYGASSYGGALLHKG